MVFLVDAAVDILKTIDGSFQGHSGIFAFQRDGQLYLVGRKAVAVVDSGIPCPHRNMIHSDETLDSYISEPFRGKSQIINEHGRIVESEAKYFALLCRDPNGDENNLEEILEIRERSRKEFPDDGRIRMVSHGTSYHSHKYGYAADGVDVSVTDARVMIRQEYFDLMRMNEQRTREELDRENSEGYVVSSLPGVSIITNNALVSFPFSSKLRAERFDRHYENKSPIICEDMVNFNREFSPRYESPYTFNVMLFGEKSQFSSPESFSEDYGNAVAMLDKLKSCYTSNVKAIIEEANSLHNSKHAKEIEDRKRISKKAESKSA